MQKYTNILLITMLLASFLGTAQNTLTGKIKSGDSLLAFATVALMDTPFGAVADENGIFILENVPNGTYLIVVSSIGYRKVEKEVHLNQNGQIDLGVFDLKEDVFGLEEVVVTDTMKETFVAASPIKVDVITARYLEKNISPTNIVEGVTLVNGVEEVVACGVCFTNSISINGLPGAYTAVLMDGSPIYGNLASVYGLNGIPTTLIDRFEVIKGPNSTLYGSEAVAGVINIITKNPEKQPLLSLDIMGTSHLESFGNIALAPKIGKFNGYVGVNYAYINDFDDNNQDGFGDVVNLDRLSAFTKWSMKRNSNKKFTIAGKYYYEDRRNGMEQYLANRAYRSLRGSDAVYGESIYTNRFELFGTYELATHENLKIDYSFSHHLQDSYYGADHYLANQNIAFANLIWSKNLVKHDLLIGGTLRYQNYDDNTVATEFLEGENVVNRPDNQFIPGVFVQDEWRTTKQLTLLTGARLDHYEAHGLIFSPRLSAKYKPSNWSTFRTNFGTGFRVVNLFTEDHAFITGQRTVEIIEALEPEKSYNVSFNFNHIFTIGESQGMIDIDANYTHFTNKIIPDYDTPGKIIYANSEGYAETKGIGITLNQQFTFPLAINASFNFQEVTQTEPDADGILQTDLVEFAPKWTGVATANYDWKKQGLNFSYTFRTTGPMTLPEVFDLDENGFPMGEARPTQSAPFSFQNIQITKDFKNKNLQVYLGIQNLGNYQQEVSPLVGFNDPNAAAGFSPYFDTAYAYSPIHGREVYLGVKWNTGKK